MKTEAAAKVAKETVYVSKPQLVQKVNVRKFRAKPTKSTSNDEVTKSKVKCYRCGKNNHVAPDCCFKNAVCNFCKITGHLKKVCRKKAQQSTRKSRNVYSVTDGDATIPKLEIAVSINDTKWLNLALLRQEIFFLCRIGNV